MDNLTRSWVFMNLITLRTFTASKWELLPTPDIVISRMREIAKRGLAMELDDGPPSLIDIRDVRPEGNLPMVDREPVRDIAPREVPVDVDVDGNSSDDDGLPDLVHDDEDNEDEDAPQPEPAVAPALRRSERVAKNVHVVSGNMSIGRAQLLHGAAADTAILSELSQMITKKI